MENKNGNLTGILSGVFWGLDSVLLGVVLSHVIFVSLGDNGSLYSTFIHDTTSFIVLLILILARGKFKDFKRVLFSKSGLIIICAGLLGGPIGMGSYIISIKYLGSSMAAGISAIYPIFGLILGYLLFKEKLSNRGIVGVVLAVLAIILMSISGIGVIDNLGIGLLAAMGCVIGWGSEAVIVGVALKEDVDAEIALGIRQMVSGLTYGLIIVPILGYQGVSEIMQQGSLLILLALAGLVGTVSYLFYYKAIGLIGAGRAMGLNISYPAWAFVFQLFLVPQFDFIQFVLVLTIIIGSILTTDEPEKLLPFLKIFERDADSEF